MTKINLYSGERNIASGFIYLFSFITLF